LETSIKQIPIHDDFVYQHGDTQVIDIVIQSGNESKAIERAAQLNTKHKTKSALHIDANPNTTVNVLVKRLRDLIEWYSYIPN
jgi:hypothetical protein